MTSKELYEKVIEKLFDEFILGVNVLLKGDTSSFGQIHFILSIFAVLRYDKTHLIFSDISELFSLISVIAMFETSIPAESHEIARTLYKEWESQIWDDFPEEALNAFNRLIKDSLSVSPLEKGGR